MFVTPFIKTLFMVSSYLAKNHLCPPASTVFAKGVHLSQLLERSMKSMHGSPFLQPSPTRILTIEAYLIGCGTHSQNVTAQGRLTPQENILHINMLELRGACYTCQQFPSHIRGHLVRIILDNRAVLYCISCQGGTRSQSSCRIHKTMKLEHITLNSDLSSLSTRTTEYSGGFPQQTFQH